MADDPAAAVEEACLRALTDDAALPDDVDALLARAVGAPSETTRLRGLLALARGDADAASRLTADALAGVTDGRARAAATAALGIAALALGDRGGADAVYAQLRTGPALPLRRVMAARIGRAVADDVVAADAAGGDAAVTALCAQLLAARSAAASPLGRLQTLQRLTEVQRFDLARVVSLQPHHGELPLWVADLVRASSHAFALLTGGRPVDPDALRATARWAEGAATRLPADVTGPRRAAVRHTLALVRLLQDDPVEAVRLAASALPESEGEHRACVLATQGLALLRLGRLPQAASLLADARAVDPDCVVAAQLEAGLPPAVAG